jgi:hypothetical protein
MGGLHHVTVMVLRRRGSTLTQEESDELPGDGFGIWLDIRRYGSDVEVATSWTDMS